MEEYKTSVRNEDEIEIDLREIFNILLSKLWIITLALVGVAIIGFAVSKFYLTPVYQSETKVYILNKTQESNITFAELQAGTQLTKDYKELITCRPVIDEVIMKLQLDITYQELASNVSVTIPTDTRIITIKVDDTNPLMAMKLANAVREAASRHIKEVMNIEAVNIVEEANVPEAPYKPSTMRNMLLGGLLGGFIATAFIIIRYMLDDTIKTPDDIEKRLGLYNLASIPIVEIETKKKNQVSKLSKRSKQTKRKNLVSDGSRG